MRPHNIYVILLTSLVLSGCTLTKSNRIQRPTHDLTNNSLNSAAIYTEDVKNQFQKKLEDQEQLGSNARLGILGGTLAAAVSTIYKAHRDTILGFGLLGTSSYAFANLYSPNVYAEIYEAGLDAAQCLNSFAGPVAVTMPIVQQGKKQLEDAINILSNTGYSGSSQEQRAKAVLDSGKQTLLRAENYLIKEPLLARQIIASTDEVVNIANKQIRVNAPNLDAFLSVGNSIISLAASTAIAVKQPLVNGGTKPSQNLPPQNIDQISNAINLVVEIERSLKNKLDDFDKLTVAENLACINKAKIAAPKSLEITGSSTVSLNVGDRYNIHVSGGRPPYSGRWIGNDPGDSIQCTRPPYSGNDFECVSKKTFAGLSYKYRVVDNDGSNKDIEFSSKK